MKLYIKMILYIEIHIICWETYSKNITVQIISLFLAYYLTFSYLLIISLYQAEEFNPFSGIPEIEFLLVREPSHLIFHADVINLRLPLQMSDEVNVLVVKI